MIKFKLLHNDIKLKDRFEEYDIKSTHLTNNTELTLLDVEIFIGKEKLSAKKVDLFALLHLFDINLLGKKSLFKYSLINDVFYFDDELNVERSHLFNCQCGDPFCAGILGECFTKTDQTYLYLYMPKEDLSIITPKLKKLFYHEKIGNSEFVVLKLSKNLVMKEILQLKIEIKKLADQNKTMLNNIDLNLEHAFKNTLFVPLVKHKEQER